MLEYVECRGCSLIYQRNIPDPTLVDALYNDRSTDPWIAYEHDKPVFANAETVATHAIEMLRVLSFLNRHPSEVSVLDVGMGWGLFGRVARGLGCNSYGTEISESKREVAAAFGTNVITISEARQSGLHFDFISADQVLEHVADPRGILEELVPLLRADGVMRLSVPNASHHRGRLKNFSPALTASGFPLNAYAPLEHLNAFSGRALRTMAAKSGLHPVEVPMLIARVPTGPFRTRMRFRARDIYGRRYYWSRRSSTHLFFQLGTLNPTSHSTLR